MNSDKSVKIFDMNKKFMGKGYVLSQSSDVIMVKGAELPVLKAGKEIIIEIYNDFSGISQYLCRVNIASVNQLNALIIGKNPDFERRNSLKVRVDLSFYIENIYRSDENVTEDFPNMKINLLNLSMGGMLISSNYRLFTNDVIEFYFHYENSLLILLKAKVVRIDKTNDDGANQLSAVNYGCKFLQIPDFYEDLITKYLYMRQLQIYRD